MQDFFYKLHYNSVRFVVFKKIIEHECLIRVRVANKQEIGRRRFVKVDWRSEHLIFKRRL